MRVATYCVIFKQCAVSWYKVLQWCTSYENTTKTPTLQTLTLIKGQLLHATNKYYQYKRFFITLDFFIVSEVLLRMHFTWRKLVLLMSWTQPKAHARVWLTRTRIFIGRLASNTRDSSFWMWRKPTLPCILPKLPTTSMKHSNPEVLNFCIHSFSCWVSHTVRNLHFLSKNSTLISRENCRFFWLKMLWFWTF